MFVDEPHAGGSRALSILGKITVKCLKKIVSRIYNQNKTLSKIYQDNLDFVVSHNVLNADFKLKKSPLARLSPEEYKSQKCGFVPPEDFPSDGEEFTAESPRPEGSHLTENLLRLIFGKKSDEDVGEDQENVNFVDWRRIGAVTNVKDQGKFIFFRRKSHFS